MSASADQPGAGSIAEFMEFLYPGIAGLQGKCPPWPADVFALVASVMRRNGGYVHCIGQTFEVDKPTPLLGSEWPDEAERIGEDWRKAIVDVLKRKAGKGGVPIPRALDEVEVPLSVQAAWTSLQAFSRDTSLDDSKFLFELCVALIKLSGYADEASYNMGLPIVNPDADPFLQVASFLLEKNGKLSFCNRVPTNKARVLAKKHTPQQGLTLRSMTHHMSLCMPWEVDAQWHEIAANRHDDILNLLILPWPLNIDVKDFRPAGGVPANNLFSEDRLFEYVRSPLASDALESKVRKALDKALAKVAKIDALVFPELALTRYEWDVVEKIAVDRKLLLIAGITDDVEQTTQRQVNSCRIRLANISEPQEVQEVREVREAYRQAKHHRWCLDRSQVLQYDLGGQIPSTKRCWENSHIGKREVFFATIGGWLTFSVLICEDLARQDPIADTLRSVGPNLVVALLMDGPQLASRWSARYASVLADDPGTSVLTVTSLGMCVRSRPAQTGPTPFTASRVIGLWKDKLYGFREISLPEKTEGCVLSLSFEAREEFTADGRSDSKGTQVPVFSGVSFIEE
jgi:hypothetical protein